MRFPTLVTAAALLAASPLVAGRAQQHAPVDAAARPVVPNAFIVQLDTDSAFTKRDGLLTTVTGLLADAGIQTRLRQDFGTLPGVFHGASVHVGPDVSAADLALVPGVKRVWPVRQFELPKPVLSSDATVYKSAPVTAAEIEAGVGLLAKRAQPTLADAYAHDTFSTHTMTQVNVTHAAGLLGKGIKIGVIDSGVDYTNSILGGCFGPGCHVSFGYDLVGDAYSGSNTPVPGGAKGPFTDCNEHGTHVSGIIGALPNAYGFTGVAPEATLGMYRIFGCTGSASEDVIFAALMMGIKDNCDVLTLSLGGLGGWIESSPSEILMDHLAKKGVVVTVAAGNAGSEGLFFTQEPADTINAFSVASTDNIDSTAYNAKIVGNGVVPILSAKPLGVGPLPVYFTSTDPTQLDDGCNPLPASTPDLAHSVVVVQRGTCTFVTKYKNVLARASGGKNVTVLIYNKVGGSTLPYLAADSTGLEQVGGLRREDGLALLKLWTAQGKNLTMDFPVGPTVPGLTDLISGGLISDYSIWGPTNDMYGQPTLSAPGGNILSSFPLALGGVGVISGTSMATPFMAGAVAVLMSARRSDKLTPLEIRSLLTTTASLTPSTLAGPELASVVQQGGGLVQLNNAVHAKTFISPYELLLNDTTHANLAQTIQITNRGKVAATYHFSSLVGQTVGVYNASGDNLPAPAPTRIPGAAAQVHFAVPWIKVQPGATFPLVVTFTPPVLDKATAALFPVYSGWVAIKSDTEAYTVPYFGLAAALLDMPVLDHSDEVYGPGSAYPFILQSGVAGNGTVQHGAHSYAHGTGPTLYSRLAAGTRSLSIDLVKADIKFIPTILNEYDLSNTTVHPRRSLSLAHRHRHRHAHTHPAPVPHSHRHHRHHSHGSQPSPSHGHPTPRTLLYRDVPIVANLFQQADAPRDNLVGGESPSPPFTDSQFGFNGTYAVLAGNKTSSATVDPLVDYRFLIRALKITGDPALEGAYESWLSSSFRIL